MRVGGTSTRGSPANAGVTGAAAIVGSDGREGSVEEGPEISRPASTSASRQTATSAEVRTGNAPNRCRMHARYRLVGAPGRR